MQKTLIYIDKLTKSLVTASGVFIDRIADYPTIERGQWQVLCVQFVEVLTGIDGIVVVQQSTLDPKSSFILVADNDFVDTDGLMFKSMLSTIPFDENDPTSNRINIEGDWYDGSTADIQKGQLSIRINSDTEKFTTVLGDKKQQNYDLFACIKQYDDLQNPSTIAWFPFVAVNTIRDWDSTTENLPEGASVAPYVRAAMLNPIEFQFSIDGEEWHDTQHQTDKYYRQRIANLQGEWSSPIAFVINNSNTNISAADIIISAESDFYGGMDVEGALQEIGAQLKSHGEAIEDNAKEIEKLKQDSGGVTAGEAAALALVFG